jgi:hypothetical protein
MVEPYLALLRNAAAITSASVIGRNGSRRLPVLLEVVVLLMPGCDY